MLRRTGVVELFLVPAFVAHISSCVCKATAGDEGAIRAWRIPSSPSVQVGQQTADTWLIKSTQRVEFTIDSFEAISAHHAECIEVRLRYRVGVNTRMVPELVCFDEHNRELRTPSALETATPWMTTNWQERVHVFPTQPGTHQVRLRLHGNGKGEIQVESPLLRKVLVDPYTTGALITSLHPGLRRGLVLESNLNAVNQQVVSNDDLPSDGKWARVEQDLDALTEPAEQGADWRSSFEDNPNVVFWSDGATLKSDTVRENRAPGVIQAVHFRATVKPGPYSVYVNDPGRAVAVSFDGENWQRYDGGAEISLGELDLADGKLELWVDACYRDPVTEGPAYFDYVRLIPSMGAESYQQLLAAAKQPSEHDPGSEVTQRDVAVSVQAPLFEAANKWPGRCGMPIPRGELSDGSFVQLLNCSGKEIPIQSRTMATWPDGTVRWLYLDFMHDLSPTASGDYTVRYGSNVRHADPADKVRITRSNEGLVVDTGVLQFLVPSSYFGIISDTKFLGQPVQVGDLSSTIEESNGTVWHAADLPVENIDIKQAGPLHAVIRVETHLPDSGSPARGFYHRAMIHAYAGSPLVQVDYFVANTDSRPAGEVQGSMSSKIDVESFELAFQTATDVQQVLHAAGTDTQPGAVVQALAADLANPQGGEDQSKSEIGWLAAKSADGTSVYVGVENFREQYPKAMRWRPDGLQIALWAREGGELEWIEGVGKTHRIALYFDRGQLADGELLAAGPVLALASPRWYCESGAFGRQIPTDQSRLTPVETALAKHIRDDVVRDVGLGFENYGDHNSGGYIKGTSLWDNNEYDLPAGCMVHFVRTGDVDALRLGLASALHYLDVDTIHYSSQHPDWQGAQHVHSHGTFGHHTAQGPDFHHAGYVQGLIWYDYFLGESVGVAGAKGIADWVLRKIYPAVGSMERAVGHPLMTLCDVYEATGDEKYLRGAAQFVDFALKWEHPRRSGWLAPITEWPAYYSGSSFCSGLLPTGLIKFNSWAMLPEIDAMLERVARWTLTDVWREPYNIVSKGGSPRAKATPWNIVTHGRLMSYCFGRTGDPLYLVVPLKMLDHMEHYSGGTRGTGRVFNHLPPLFAAMQQEGSPQLDPHCQIELEQSSIPMALGETKRVRASITNTGDAAITGLRMSLHSRNDIKVLPSMLDLESLPAQESREIVVQVSAPQQLNLTCTYNRVAVLHASALYHCGDEAQGQHETVSLVFGQKK